jgi:hypothetical protein
VRIVSRPATTVYWPSPGQAVRASNEG